jgi:hypothetical protein
MASPVHPRIATRAGGAAITAPARFTTSREPLDQLQPHQLEPLDDDALGRFDRALGRGGPRSAPPATRDARLLRFAARSAWFDMVLARAASVMPATTCSPRSKSLEDVPADRTNPLQDLQRM